MRNIHLIDASFFRLSPTGNQNTTDHVETQTQTIEFEVFIIIHT